MHRSRAFACLLGLLLLYATVLLIYAETRAFTWDESCHLVAAQLMAAGKKPYIDFVFPQTPLNAYWNAAWMRVLGPSWRIAHASAALFTIGAVVLTAQFAFVRFPIPRWRIAVAVTAGLATGLNAMVFIYGPVAQAYGICLFMLALSFRFAVRAVDTNGPLRPMAAGLFAGAAAASSLLTAAAAPVLLVWMLLYNRAGRRWTKLSAFVVGEAVPVAPVFRLFSQGPRQTWFNLVQYHIFYRKLYWPDTTRHDLEILTSWIDSGQALAIGLLAVCGLLYIARRSRWPTALRAEFYLSAWLAAALSAEVGLAHPTFARYFLLSGPFFAILAATGLYAIASRLLDAHRPLWPVLLVVVFLALGLAKTLYERREIDTWSPYERLARKVDEVTPRNAPLFANEPIYFLTRRTPPPGLEFAYSHLVDLGPSRNVLMHILTESDVKREVQSGMFATAFSCDDEQIDDYGLPKLYQRRVDMDDCSIFWDWKK